MTEAAFSTFLDTAEKMLERVAQTWCGEWDVTRRGEHAVVELRTHDRRRRKTIRTVYQITAVEAGRATPEDLVRAVVHDHAEVVVVESRRASEATSTSSVGRLNELGRKLVLG